LHLDLDVLGDAGSGRYRLCRFPLRPRSGCGRWTFYLVELVELLLARHPPRNTDMLAVLAVIDITVTQRRRLVKRRTSLRACADGTWLSVLFLATLCVQTFSDQIVVLIQLRRICVSLYSRDRVIFLPLTILLFPLDYVLILTSKKKPCSRREMVYFGLLSQ
jgi:hypothetical protein